MYDSQHWIVLPSGRVLNLNHVVYMNPHPSNILSTVPISREYTVVPTTGYAITLGEADASALYKRLTAGGELKREEESRS